jgi:hypothetical protein
LIAGSSERDDVPTDPARDVEDSSIAADSFFFEDPPYPADLRKCGGPFCLQDLGVDGGMVYEYPARPVLFLDSHGRRLMEVSP